MKSILVVDDEPGGRLSLQAVFHPDSRVVLAADGAEALRCLEGDSFDLAVVDLLMPGMTGMELLPALRRADPQLVVVILSAMNDQHGHPDIGNLSRVVIVGWQQD